MHEPLTLPQHDAVAAYSHKQILEMTRTAHQTAWQLLEEEAAQVALCPLSITLYQVAGEAGEMFLTYRSPGQSTAGRMKAEKLLQRLVDRSIELARLRW